MILICACPLIRVQAQINLVLNPSFEQYNNCPQDLGEVRYATWWNCPDTSYYPNDTLPITCVPDYINECSSFSYSSAPANELFYHFPRTGNGMMEAMLYTDSTDSIYRGAYNYLQGTLKSTLVAGQAYCVTFYIASEQCSGWATNNIGAYFDNGTIDTVLWQNCGYPQTQYSPQVNDTSIINDTLNWVQVQGSFTANGTESFITIGNFFDSAHTQAVPVVPTMYIQPPPSSNYFAYYLIDDVSVIPINATANAGPGGVTSSTGDSVWIGTTDGYLPCMWYIVGAGLIDSNIAGFNVHPDTTTSYVMALTVCGTTTYDTTTVTVVPEGIPALIGMCNVQVFPNPVTDVLHITGLQDNTTYSLLNVAGISVQSGILHKGNNSIAVQEIFPGTYLFQLTGAYGEKKVVRVTKE